MLSVSSRPLQFQTPVKCAHETLYEHDIIARHPSVKLLYFQRALSTWRLANI